LIKDFYVLYKLLYTARINQHANRQFNTHVKKNEKFIFIFIFVADGK